MGRLSDRETATFSRALLLLNAEDDPASLSQRVLACVRATFDCEFVSFSRMDLPAGRLQTTAFSPSRLPDWPGIAMHQRFLAADPAAAYIMRTHSARALKISDFVSLRQYRDLPIYTEVFARVGCNRRLGFAMQKTSPSAMIVTLNRAGKDFSEADRTRLDLLRPHLLQANGKARDHERWCAARRHDAPGAGAGLLEVDATGKLVWASARAHALLQEFFPGASDALLPADLQNQIGPVLARNGRALASRASPLPERSAWQFAGPGQRRLNVRLTLGVATGAGQWQLLLTEVGISPALRACARVHRLTNREVEVLHWLVQGKTNAEIGTILAVADKTVGKHLEHVFAKLGVENCTSAVSLAMGSNAGLAYSQ